MEIRVSILNFVTLLKKTVAYGMNIMTCHHLELISCLYVVQ